MEIHGIDVSTWQGTIDWNKVAASGIEFAMIRAAYGHTGIDDEFAHNIENAANAGIHCGAYLYSYARSEEEAKLEAQHFLNVIAPYSLAYPVAFDMEEGSLTSLGKEQLTAIALAFCQTVKDAGYYVCIYSNLYWLDNYLDTGLLADFDIWLAQWYDRPTYTGNFGIWQYTSKGSVDGIGTAVDMNISYRDYPAIIANGNPSVPTTPTEPEPLPSVTYTVQSGDTLSGIAQNYGVSLDALLAANPQIENPNIIFRGQVLTIPQENGSVPEAPQETTAVQYTIVSGDTLSGIAQNYGISLSTLLTANPQIENPNLIFPGQELTIPQENGSVPEAPQESTATQYTVVSGDTLSGIAQGYGVSLSALLTANPQIENPNIIYTGQVLNIPV